MKQTSQDLIYFDASQHKLLCQGEWTLVNLVLLQDAFAKTQWSTQKDLTVDGSAITKMDSAGAWLLSTELKKITNKDAAIQIQNLSEQHKQLLMLVEKQHVSKADLPTIKKWGWLAVLGRFTVKQLREFRDFLNFTGQIAIETLLVVRHPKRFRWMALANVVDKTGLQALPIIALLSFMIGVVIAYQMGIQLRTYGANVFIVDFVGLAVLREFGPLLTAIMVAGRTGSAFTAELGAMKINQEIDALNTMGVTPAELLLLPRLIGLFITLPLLAVWADIFGVLGGMMMAKNMLSLSTHDFLLRFQHVIPLKTLLIGVGKAPVFAMLIGSVGCFQGLRVELSADSVGKKTTRSVVLAIFFIILADAIFSIILSKVKL